jgi:hypothetical protein
MDLGTALQEAFSASTRRRLPSLVAPVKVCTSWMLVPQELVDDTAFDLERWKIPGAATQEEIEAAGPEARQLDGRWHRAFYGSWSGHPEGIA